MKPNGYISPFCTNLTGITQQQVDEALPLEHVLKAFSQWIYEKQVEWKLPFIMPITCGDWDLRVQLPKECNAKGLPVPSVLKDWINIKDVFSSFYGTKPKGMVGMLKYLHLQLKGRHHSGIDDVRNITQIVMRLLAKGAPMRKVSPAARPVGARLPSLNSLSDFPPLGSSKPKDYH